MAFVEYLAAIFDQEGVTAIKPGLIGVRVLVGGGIGD